MSTRQIEQAEALARRVRTASEGIAAQAILEMTRRHLEAENDQDGLERLEAAFDVIFAKVNADVRDTIGRLLGEMN